MGYYSDIRKYKIFYYVPKQECHFKCNSLERESKIPENLTQINSKVNKQCSGKILELDTGTEDKLQLRVRVDRRTLW